MITLYDHPRSGNCHKIRLLLSSLKLDHESIFVDVPAGVHRQDWFTRINPLAQIPTLTDGDFTIQDSQAILIYLAKRYDNRWFSDDAQQMGRIAEWLSFAAKEIAVGLQASRLYFQGETHIDIADSQKKGLRVLQYLDRHLAARQWLCLDRPTIADLACFPYVGLAREGKLPLDEFPHVLAWIQRIVRLDGYVTMPGLPEKAS
jgi:glutathione S-transferase